MSLQALNPAPPPHSRFDDYACRRAKRSKRVSDDEYLAGCLVALRSGGEASSSSAADLADPITATKSSPSADRIYKCSVCGKGFQSHQALGGHKASHRSKPQTAGAAEERKAPSNSASTDASNCESAPGPHRLHKCSTCGRSFPSGQALGGHMRKHYGGVIGASKSGLNSSDGGNGGDGFSAVTSFSGGGGGAVSCSYGDGDGGDVTAVASCLDLNLPTEEELDLTLKL